MRDYKFGVLGTGALNPGRSGVKALEWEAVYGRPQPGVASRIDTSKRGLAQLYKRSSFGFRVVNERARAVAGVRLELVDAAGEPFEHVLADVLKHPMQGVSGHQLWAMTERDRSIYGEAFWLMLGSGDVPDTLRRLNPVTMEVKAGAAGIGEFIQKIDGKQSRFSPEQMVYFCDYDPLDDLRGFAGLSVAAGAISAEYESQRFVQDFFKNDAKPALLLSSEQDLAQDEIEETAGWFARMFRGAGKRHRTGLLGQGFKPYELGYNPAELALADVRAENRRDICAAMDVPPSVAGAWEAANYAASRQEQASFFVNFVVERCQDYLATMNVVLVPYFGLPDGVRLRWAFEEIPAIQWALAKRHELLDAWVEAGIIDRDQARREVVG